jgi:hypothetical protein
MHFFATGTGKPAFSRALSFPEAGGYKQWEMYKAITTRYKRMTKMHSG